MKKEKNKKGHLEIGVTESGEVVVNHPDLGVDEHGNGYIVFTPGQASLFAAGLLKAAKEAVSRNSQIVNSIDARDWAREFVACARAVPAIATDEGTITSWFASALVAGRNHASRRKTE